MNRKAFLRSFVPAALGAFAANKLSSTPNYKDFISSALVPPYLKGGNTIAITCPAGYVEPSSLQSCFKTLKRWGLNVKYGDTVGKRWQRFGGTDAERLRDFQSLLDSDNIDAIIFGRGGYGTMRIIDEVNWEKFKQKPKWLVGFSDITTVHLHIHANLGVPTVHAEMSSNIDEFSLSSKTLQDVLFGKPLHYIVKGHEMNRAGNADGILIGGNLSIIQACSGSKSDINTDGKLLFIEEVNEYKYQIDRMLTHLKRSGKLENLAALVVGEFAATKDHQEMEFQHTVEELIWDKVKEYDYPVCFKFPSGHVKNNLALKMGVKYKLNISKTQVELKEVMTTGSVEMPVKDSSALNLLTQ